MNKLLWLLATLLIFLLLVLAGTCLWHTVWGVATWRVYRWAALGAVAYTVFHFFVRRNIRWLETASHELTHVAVSMLFLREVREMNVSDTGNGLAVTAGKSFANVPVSLAPYCLPLFAYLLLALRPLIRPDGSALMIYDILVGLVIAFHVHCFTLQTGRYQPDINSYPLPFSFAYIFTFLFFNANVFLLAFQPGENVFTALWHTMKAMFLTLAGWI